MLIYPLNFFKKIIFIIFVFGFLFIISLKHSLATNHLLSVEELEISQNIDLKFSRNKIIDYAFKEAFNSLLTRILNSKDINKVKNIKLKEIKNLVENFKIKNEIFRENKYYANFYVYFNKKKVKYFLEKKHLFYSNPQKITVLFLPIVIDGNKLYLFNENIFYNNWLIDKHQNELINYIVPLEDIVEISKLLDSKKSLENFDMLETAAKYNTKNYIFSIININEKNLNFFSKIKFEENKKNINLIFNTTNINDGVLVKNIIKEVKLKYEDIWKDFNEINTSMALSLNLILSTNSADKIFEFENALNKIDDIRLYSIKNFNLNETIYEIIYNSDPNKLKKQISMQGFSIISDESFWVVQ